MSVLYATTAGLAPLVGLWLVCLAWLVRLYAGDIARLARAVRERLARKDDPRLADASPVPASPDAPPPVVA